MKKSTTYQTSMIAMGVPMLAADSGVSSGSIYDKLAVNGQTGQAFAFTLMFAVVLFVISFTAFLKGLELAQQPHSAKRSANLGILGLIVIFLIAISILMNAWFIGGDPMRQEWLNASIEEVVQDGRGINNLFEYAEDEKSSLKSISATTTSWLKCEKASGCVGKEGGGDGQTTLVLSNYLTTANNAQNDLMELSNTYTSVLERANELYLELSFITDMKHLNFDQKMDKTEQSISKLSETLNELQNLLPIRTFQTLADGYDASVNQYVAQGITPVGSRTLFNFYHKHAERYELITNNLKRGKLVHIKEINKPSDWEILTSSSNGLFIWLMATVLASFGWLMLVIHIIQNTEFQIDATEDQPIRPTPNNPERITEETPVLIRRTPSSTIKH